MGSRRPPAASRALEYPEDRLVFPCGRGERVHERFDFPLAPREIRRDVAIVKREAPGEAAVERHCDSIIQTGAPVPL